VTTVEIPEWAERIGAEWRCLPAGGLDKMLALLAAHHECLPLGFEDKCLCLGCEMGRCLVPASDTASEPTTTVSKGNS
jgi:hypothetical protein